MRLLTLLLIFQFCLFSPGIFSQEIEENSEKRLFYIERSKNRNLVCYDVNVEEGLLNVKQPLEVYWVNQEEHPGKVSGLSRMEKRLAYGYKITSQGEDTCTVVLTAYPGRELTIYRKENNYICTILINNRPAILQKLYVKAKSNNSLSVEYVQLTGISIDTGEEISEKYANKMSGIFTNIYPFWPVPDIFL